MFKNYFKTAWRSLLKNKTTSLINVMGLSVGMTAAVLILLWVQNEKSFDNYHTEANSIYRVTTKLIANNWTWETSPLLLADVAKNEIPEIEKIARLNTSNWPVFNINGRLAYEKKCAYVDEGWFSIFKYNFIEGNAASFGSDPYTIILTVSAAKEYFGNYDVVGSVIRIDNINYQVKAIVADAPSNSSFQYNAFLPIAALLTNQQLKQNDEQWGNFNYITFIKLKANTTAQVAAKKLTTVLQKNNNDKGVSLSLTPLKGLHFDSEIAHSEFVRGSMSTVYIFSILAFLLLLIACINYVNLTTAKASLRAKEVSVRKIVGAKRTHLFYQFIAESLLVSIVSVCITLVLIHICLPAFNTVTGKDFVLPITSINMWRIIGITLLAALLLNSIYPALLLSSFKPLNVFRGINVLKVKDAYFRKGLVTVQFVISVTLIAATIIIYKQMRFIQYADPGYNRSQIVQFPMPLNIDRGKKPLLVEAIKQDLLKQSAIQYVTAANQPIVNIGSMSTGSADWEGHDTTYNPTIVQLSTDADFLKTMEVQMKEGRWFQAGNMADKKNVVLNETAVKELNIHKPVIGQRFTFKGRTGQIIGVVKDFKYKSFHDKTGSLIAFNDPNWFSFVMVRIAPGRTTEAMKAIQRTWDKFVPQSPIEYSFLDDAFSNLYKEDQRTAYLVFVFAVIAIIISSLGLFALTAFTAEQRVKEIGIRKVLGATIVNITTLLSKDFLKLVFVAILISTPIALWMMNKWIQNFAYRIEISWWIFVTAGLLALLIAFVTISFQAIKAAIANPVKSLRTE
jgi:ABC-type antimicrobial peptide transport system permease subunit